MEAIKHQQGNMNKFSLSIFLKKATVVSVSIFSLIFAYSFSSYAVQIAHNVDKSYMFLLGNGILVLVVKNSAGLIGNSQQESDDLHGKNDLKKAHHNQAEVFNSSEQKQSIKEVAQEKKDLSTSVCMECAAEDQEEQDNENEDHMNVTADHQDDQEDSSGLPSVELNKKCDDFIRKMKKEIKFGHQRLIMV